MKTSKIGKKRHILRKSSSQNFEKLIQIPKIWDSDLSADIVRVKNKIPKIVSNKIGTRAEDFFRVRRLVVNSQGEGHCFSCETLAL